MHPAGTVASRAETLRSGSGGPTARRPRVLLVGGPDVDARLDLMRALSGAIAVGALGTRPALRAKFAAAGFDYKSYLLSRRVNPVLDLITVGQLMLIFRRSRPDVVHAFDTKPGIWACLAARWAGVPVVIGTVTGLGALYAGGAGPGATRRIFELLQRWTSHVADATVFQNPDDARRFIAAGIVPAEKARLLPGSGVDTARFDGAQTSAAERARIREELGLRPGQVVVTMVARVIRSKGAVEFAEAAHEIPAARSDVRWILAGPADGDARDRLGEPELTALRESGIWIGPRSDVPALLSVSDIFVLPSAYPEGIPRVLLEAAAMGLGIVTVDAPGCREVVEHDVTGLLVPARDGAALREAIRRLLDAPALRARLGRAARRRAVARFDLAVVAAQTDAVYRQLLIQKGVLRAPGTAPDARRAAPDPTTRRRFYGTAKRIFDVLFAAGALLVTWPLILTGALATTLTSRGPAFYRARRAGLGGRPFAMVKLRTMRAGADVPGRRITAKEDDRVTPVGAVLRRFQIDELPQFWNVLRGEMAVVGPRAEDWDVVRQHYSPAQWRTLDIRPGMVSPADITWYPNLTYHDPPPPGVSAEEHYIRRHMPLQLAECLRYMERQSLLHDLTIILLTAYCVLIRSWWPPRRKALPAAPAENAAELWGRADRRGEARP